MYKILSACHIRNFHMMKFQEKSAAEREKKAKWTRDVTHI
jgi:hypothetical protein